jgi:acetyl-CoA acetyltransferase
MRETYIVGVGMTPFGRFPTTSLSEFAARASRGALDDAGLAPSPVNGMSPAAYGSSYS